MAGRRLLDNLQDLMFLRRRPEVSALLFDLDGTLSPIVDDPMKAPFTPEARQAVADLAETYALVAVVSGRAADALSEIIGLPGLTYVGNHGLEILEGGSRRVLVPMELQRRLRVISKTLAEELRGIPGIFYEDKDLSVAIHYRGAEDQAAALGRIQRALGGADLTGFIIKEGKKLVQIRPVGGINKGSTVSLLMKERGLTQGLYAGDDLTDLDVFAVFRDLRAEGYNVVSVGVVDAETNPLVPEAADYVAAGPTEVGRLLVWLCEPRPSEA